MEQPLFYKSRMPKLRPNFKHDDWSSVVTGYHVETGRTQGFDSLTEVARFMKVQPDTVTRVLRFNKIRRARHVIGTKRGEKWLIFEHNEKMSYVKEVLKEHDVPC